MLKYGSPVKMEDVYEVEKKVKDKKIQDERAHEQSKVDGQGRKNMDQIGVKDTKESK